VAPPNAGAATGELPGVDLGEVATWMAGRGVHVRPPLHGRRVGRGQSNLTYRIEDTDGRCWVLRRPPLGSLLVSAHDVAREHRILAALADTDVPVPRVVGLRHADGDQLVMEHVDGLVVDRMDVAERLPDAVRAELGGRPTSTRPCSCTATCTSAT
jgi:aminoglycoside phosphotransferase (APT) family kinase protein